MRSKASLAASATPPSDLRQRLPTHRHLGVPHQAQETNGIALSAWVLLTEGGRKARIPSQRRRRPFPSSHLPRVTPASDMPRYAPTGSELTKVDSDVSKEIAIGSLAGSPGGSGCPMENQARINGYTLMTTQTAPLVTGWLRNCLYLFPSAPGERNDDSILTSPSSEDS